MERIKIVARYKDGGVIKGYTQNFNSNRPHFHLFPVDTGFSSKAVEVIINDLKAVFFVSDFTGNPQYNERKEFTQNDKPLGQKVEVTFVDGEILVGSTMGYNPQRPGFFLFLVDSKSNNQRVFVVSSAVKNVRFL
ncbi:MAG: DUF6982 domain-containing protein [Thermodesulfobacteriota bacterium]